MTSLELQMSVSIRSQWSMGVEQMVNFSGFRVLLVGGDISASPDVVVVGNSDRDSPIVANHGRPPLSRMFSVLRDGICSGGFVMSTSQKHPWMSVCSLPWIF